MYQIENAAQKLFLLSNQGKSDNTYSNLAFLVENITKRIEFARSNEGTLQGISVGFRDLDQLLNGLQKSDLIILAARPSMGKTALALNMALNACKLLYSTDQYTGMHIGFFSLEMSAEQLASRVIAIESEVSSYIEHCLVKLVEKELNKVINAVLKCAICH